MKKKDKILACGTFSRSNLGHFSTLKSAWIRQPGAENTGTAKKALNSGHFVPQLSWGQGSQQ